MTTFTPRLHHFATSVENLDRTATWYREKLGFRDEYRYEVAELGMRAAFLVLGEVRLELFQMADSRPAPEDELRFDRYLGVRGLKHVALAVDDLDGARAELEAAGVEFTTEPMEVPDSGGARFCFLADPDGVLIELFEPA
jgi:catechol 2,3-dioxygenase-like lactoylglutathione lyase family enzyme